MEELHLNRYFVNDGKIDVYVTEWGKKDKPIIFCLHGLGSTSLSFIEVAEKLKNDYRIFSIDAPGHGKTSPFQEPEDYEMPSIVKWLNNLLNIIEIKNFYFLSHSWGSFVALFYLLEYPEKVKGSILIDGGYQSKRLQQQSMEDEIDYYVKDFEVYVDSWDKFLNDVVYSNVSRRSSSLDIAAKDLVLEKDNKFYWHARGTTAGNIIKAMHKHEILDIYEKLPSEILLLRATLPKDKDNYRNSTSDIFKQKVGGVVKLIPNTTHMLHHDNPDIVVEEIRKNWIAPLN